MRMRMTRTRTRTRTKTCLTSLTCQRETRTRTRLIADLTADPKALVDLPIVALVVRKAQADPLIAVRVVPLDAVLVVRKVPRALTVAPVVPAGMDDDRPSQSAKSARTRMSAKSNWLCEWVPISILTIRYTPRCHLRTRSDRTESSGRPLFGAMRPVCRIG